MMWNVFSRRRKNTDELRQRFVNVVDESLMRRIEEKRERLCSAGIQVTPVLRVQDNPAEPTRRLC